MASPFSFFRKYSGGMMIVMVILSMLLFTMTDLFSDPGANLWLLGLLLGGGIFAIAGIGQGRWLQWGLGGAVLGTLLGVILPEFVQSGGLATSLGVITEEDIYDLQLRRSLANEFVAQATEASFGQGMRQFATYFGFGHPGNEDVILGKLLRAEADRLGIVVDSRMVGDYLKRITDEKLTAEAYVKIRNGLSYDRGPLMEETLQEILADEIKARMAYQMLRTRTTTLPPGAEVYWDYYKRLNVRQQIEVAALDVDLFVDQVDDPTDQQIAELFSKYRTKFPNEVEPGSPGFRLPLRAELAYLELDSKAVEAEIGEISDAEIEAYYNANKETPLIRTPVLPDSPKPADEAPESKEEPAKEERAKEEPAKEEPAKEEPAKEEPAKEEPAKEEPAKEEPAKEEPAKEEPAKEEPAKEEPTKEEPAKEEPAKEEPAEEEVSEKPAAEPEAKTEESSGDDCSPFGPDEAKADEAKADEAADTKPADEVPATEAAPAADEKPAAAEEKPAPAAEEKPAGTLPTLTIPDASEVPAVPQQSEMPAQPEIQYEYRELNDALKQEIRQEILRQKVAERVQEKMQAAKAFMEGLASERTRERFAIIEKAPGRYSGESAEQRTAFLELRTAMQPIEDKLDEKLQEYAKKNGFEYVETPMISYQNLVESEDYSIATATEPVVNPMNAPRSTTVPLTIFRSFSADHQNNDAQLYFTRLAQRDDFSRDGGVSHFAYWATDYSMSHVPELSEVSDMVVQEWKRLQARELVQTRGAALAEQIREGLTKVGEERLDMSAVLAEKTVTGAEKGTSLVVRRSNPFSWLRTSSASPMSFQQPQATMSQIQFDDEIGGALEKTGEEFMRSIFEEMQDEEVKVVPNADRSKYLIVHVTNRFPTPEIGEDTLRERFATEAQKFSFRDSPILGIMQQQLDGPASLAWEKDLWRKYGVDPDAEPEEN